MRTSLKVLAALAAAGFASTVAGQTPGIAGKWYSQSGSKPYLTIYQAGPEYSAALTDTEGTTKAGSKNAQPGRYQVMLQNFRVTGNAVTFRTYVQFLDGSGSRVQGTITTDYDLKLSDEGLRLIGTTRSSGMFGDSSNTETLFKRE